MTKPECLSYRNFCKRDIKVGLFTVWFINRVSPIGGCQNANDERLAKFAFNFMERKKNLFLIWFGVCAGWLYVIAIWSVILSTDPNSKSFNLLWTSFEWAADVNVYGMWFATHSLQFCCCCIQNISYFTQYDNNYFVM